jgi:PRTRC genetic system ThiF family protein
MKIQHSIHSSLLSRTVKVAVVGAGGTGSALLPRLMQLHHAMLATGHPGGLHVIVYDDDVVSTANIGRQGFFPCDVGVNKAIVLVHRLNMGWCTSWQAVPRRVDGMMKIHADIVIGCVDSRAARKTILKSISSSEAYYLDGGNSENTGQVVIGEVGNVALMQRPNRLPTVADLFPEMVDETLDAADNAPSCSLAESLRKQSLVINMAVAVEMFNLLWILFRTGALTYSGKFINLESGTSVPIRLDTDTWERMGYKYRAPPKQPTVVAGVDPAAGGDEEPEFEGDEEMEE